MPLDITLNIAEREKVVKMAKALGSPERLAIIELLTMKNYNMYELSHKLNIPFATVSRHINVLYGADVIFINEGRSRKHTVMKTCSLRMSNILISLYSGYNPFLNNDKFFSHTMPIGLYSECRVVPPCGMWSDEGEIAQIDNPLSFFHEDRIKAQLLCFSKGFVEYKFMNNCYDTRNVTGVEAVFECCSEAPNYRLDWPSDITVWLNGTEIGTWQSPSDFGGRSGRLNPKWWPAGVTQYGMLKSFKIDGGGAYIDGVKCSEATLNDVDVYREMFLTLKIGIKDGAQNQGGLNLFGERFGDYPQNITIKTYFE